MRTFLIVTATLLLTCSLSFAQASGQSAQAKQASVSGCLSGPNSEGAYMLKTSKGRTIEVGGTDELKNHVGHEVKLNGEWAKSGTEIGENEAAEKGEHATAEKSEGQEAHESAERGEHHGGRERHLKVASIDMISTSCSAPAK